MLLVTPECHCDGSFLLFVCSKLNLIDFDQIYRKTNNIYTPNLFVESTMKYTLIMHMFSSLVVIFFYRFNQIYINLI